MQATPRLRVTHGPTSLLACGIAMASTSAHTRAQPPQNRAWVFRSTRLKPLQRHFFNTRFHNYIFRHTNDSYGN